MAEGHYLAARHLQTQGRQAQAEPLLEAAVGHNPSFAAAHALLAQVLLLTGRSEEGLTRMKHASHLGPRAFVAGLAVAHFACGQYAEALAAAERSIATNPSYPFGRAIAVASAWCLDDRAAAAAHVAALRTIEPGFVPARFRETFGADVAAVSLFARTLEAACARSA
jgi:tetratricopeptide (TPR) repeat protein